MALTHKKALCLLLICLLFWCSMFAAYTNAEAAAAVPLIVGAQILVSILAIYGIQIAANASEQYYNDFISWVDETMTDVAADVKAFIGTCVTTGKISLLSLATVGYVFTQYIEGKLWPEIQASESAPITKIGEASLFMAAITPALSTSSYMSQYNKVLSESQDFVSQVRYMNGNDAWSGSFYSSVASLAGAYCLVDASVSNNTFNLYKYLSASDFASGSFTKYTSMRALMSSVSLGAWINSSNGSFNLLSTTEIYLNPSYNYCIFLSGSSNPTYIYTAATGTWTTYAGDPVDWATDKSITLYPSPTADILTNTGSLANVGVIGQDVALDEAGRVINPGTIGVLDGTEKTYKEVLDKIQAIPVDTTITDGALTADTPLLDREGTIKDVKPELPPEPELPSIPKLLGDIVNFIQFITNLITSFIAMLASLLAYMTRAFQMLLAYVTAIMDFLRQVYAFMPQEYVNLILCGTTLAILLCIFKR